MIQEVVHPRTPSSLLSNDMDTPLPRKCILYKWERFRPLKTFPSSIICFTDMKNI